MMLRLMLFLLVVASPSAWSAAPARTLPYTESICTSNPDVFFCEDFEGEDITCLGNQNCNSNWTNPAIETKDICWCGGGSYQFNSETIGGLTSGNRVWRISKDTAYTDVVTDVNTGTGDGTLAGFLDDTIMGSGAQEWYARAQIWFSADHVWPQSVDYKIGVWALPAEFLSPPSAQYENGLYFNEDFFCSAGGNFNDVLAIRFGGNFGQFPYQNEYCPPLAVGQPANGTNAVRFERERWYTVEVHFRLGTTDGIMELWIDGNLAYQATGRDTCGGEPCLDMRYIMILGFTNPADPAAGYSEIDNIVYSRAPIGVPEFSAIGVPRASPTALRIILQ